MKTLVILLAWTVGLAGPTLGTDDDPKDVGPKRPDEAFAVYVLTNLEDGADRKYKAEKVKKEVEKRIKKQKHWFIVAKSPDKAEIIVEIVRHTLDERVRHQLVSRVDVSGNAKNCVTETWM